MSSRINVTLMSPDPTVATAVTAALQSNGHVLAGPAVRDLRDLAAQLTRSPAPIVLIDLDPQPQQVLPHLERIIARFPTTRFIALRSEEHTSELQSRLHLVCRLLLEKKKNNTNMVTIEPPPARVQN